ncbi:MAG: translocation/assembly module TamB domain-containing protein [Flavobacteriales bacterium]
MFALIAIAVLVKSYSFQTWLAGQVASYFESELHTKIHIERVEIDVFKRLLIRNLYVEDLHGDTLLFTNKLETSIKELSLKNDYVKLHHVTVNKPRIKLKTYKGEKDQNLQFLLDYFADDSPKDPDSKPFLIYATSVKLKDGFFSVDDDNVKPKKKQMDFDHLRISSLNVSLTDFKNRDDTVQCQLTNLSLKEKSGLYVKELHAAAKIAPNGILLDNLSLKTQYTSLTAPRLWFQTGSYDDYGNFENQVKITCWFRHSLLSMRDISYFSSDLYGASHQLILNGRIEGTLNDVKARGFTIGTSEDNYIMGNFHITNLTNADSLYIDATVRDMNVGMQQVALVEVAPYNATQFLPIPDEVLRMGIIKGTGNFHGTLREYKANFNANTFVGGISGGIVYKETGAGFVSDITVQTTRFALGKVIDNNNLSTITSSLQVHGSGKQMNEFGTYHVEGKIASVGFSGYEYTNIDLDGDLSKLIFDGHFDVKDPNLMMDYNGILDLRKKIPVFNFTSHIAKANIHKLNLLKRDESTSVACNISGDGKGSNLDNFRGSISIDDLVIEEKEKKYFISHSKLEAVENADKSKKLEFDSDVMYAKFEGFFNFSELPNTFMSVLSEGVPSLFDNKKIKITSREVFDYKVELRDFTIISELFVPSLTLSKNILFTGKFDSENNNFRFRAPNKIDKIKFNNQYFQNVTKFDTKYIGDYLSVEFISDRLVLNDSVDLQKFTIKTQGLDNKFETAINWDNKSGKSGNISFLGDIRGHDEFEIMVNKVEVVIAKGRTLEEDEKWVLEKKSLVNIDSSTISVVDFNAFNKEQTIKINGKISRNPSDKFITDIQNFNLESITPLLVGNELELEGKMHGYFSVSNVYTTPNFKTELKIDSFSVNKEYVGLVDLKSYYDEPSERIIAAGKIIRKEIPDLDFLGSYYVKLKENSLDFIVNMKDANLKLINGFLPPDISNFRGLADGKFTVKGTPEKPLLKGKIFVHDGFVKVNMLNTSYFFGNGTISLDDGIVTLDKMRLEDVRGNSALLNATYNHNNFVTQDIAFDIIDMKKMLVLNTTEELNPLYYGKAYASGSVSVLMYDDKMDVEVNVTTEKNTKIFLPLYGDEDVSLGDFVEFVKHDTDVVKAASLEGISLTFNLDVTPDAEINIIFDPISGQSLKVRGNGNIEMNISPTGEFTMEGPYEVEDGKFIFALKSYVRKEFKVAKGSRITWFGDPYLADLNIKTIYYLQTSMFPLMPPDLANNYRKNTDVQCVMHLTNTLENPLISFDIIVPRADDNIKSVLNSIRANEQELTTQFFTLLVVNTFITPSSGVGNNQSAGSNIAVNYSTELLTNKFNALLSKATGSLDVGFNYKPGDNISNNEIAVALSKQSKDGRLVLSTNLGVSQGNNANNNPSSFVGEFNLEYMLNEEGDVRLRAYNESNEFNITNVQQSPYTQGVAVFYQKEFDSSKDIKVWQKFLNIFRRKEKDVKFEKKEKPKEPEPEKKPENNTEDQ